MSLRASAVSINFGLSDTRFRHQAAHCTGIAIAPTATPMTDVGAWVCLGDQVGQITKLDTGGKCAVAIVNGPTKWRTVKDVSSIFGTSGVPKAMLMPGDWVRLTDKKAGELVGQLIKIEGGRFNVKLMDGKTLWRGLADLTPPFDDAPALPILGTAQPAKEASRKPSASPIAAAASPATPPALKKTPSKPPPTPPPAEAPSAAPSWLERPALRKTPSVIKSEKPSESESPTAFERPKLRSTTSTPAAAASKPPPKASAPAPAVSSVREQVLRSRALLAAADSAQPSEPLVIETIGQGLHDGDAAATGAEGLENRPTLARPKAAGRRPRGGATSSSSGGGAASASDAAAHLEEDPSQDAEAMTPRTASLAGNLAQQRLQRSQQRANERTLQQSPRAQMVNRIGVQVLPTAPTKAEVSPINDQEARI